MSSFNCLLLGETFFKKIFPVGVADTIISDNMSVPINDANIGHFKRHIWFMNKTKFSIDDPDNINLWKVEVKDESKLKDVFTEEDIQQKLNGTFMEPMNMLIDDYFPDKPPFKRIHIIIAVPTSNGPSQQGITQEPNWNNASSIYKWIQQFKLNRGRNQLVKTYGFKFEFHGRDDAINTLWNGDSLTGRNGIVGRFEARNKCDKNLHPVPVIAGGPGTGKSRFLDEVERLLGQYANKSNDEEIRNAFTNIIVVNTTYGNGSPAGDLDKALGAEASIAIRILYEYFRPKHLDSGDFDYSSFREFCNCSNISSFSLATALRTVYIDAKKTEKVTTSNPLLTLVIGIDEFNKLYDADKVVSKTLIHSIGGAMCESPANIFFIPILAGTVEGPLEQYISGSMHKPLRIPLYLLEENYAIEIGKAMDLFDDNYVKCHPYFRVSISDIGGHVRSLEYFYRAFEKEKRQRDLNNVKLNDIMTSVKHNIREDYNLLSYSTWLTEALAKAILGLPVKKSDKIMIGEESTSYQDLSSMGILNLVLVNPSTGDHQIRLPYSWASVLVQASNNHGMTYWKSMFDYDEPMYWQNFEDFNVKFWALRLSLFKLLGRETIKLKELLSGAKFSRGFPEVEVILPEKIDLCKLQHRYPVTKTKNVKNDDDIEVSWHSYIKLDCLNNDDIEKYINASGAPLDVFSFLKYHIDDAKTKNLCVTQQVKLTNIVALKPMSIDQDLFNDEHKKVTKAIMDVPVENWTLLFLTNADVKNDLSILCKKNSTLISKKQFNDFYGYTYANRAQFASANERILINSAPPESLQILGFTNNQRHDISLKRLKRPFCDLDDMKNRINISDSKFKKLKRDDRIAF